MIQVLTAMVMVVGMLAASVGVSMVILFVSFVGFCLFDAVWYSLSDTRRSSSDRLIQTGAGPYRSVTMSPNSVPISTGALICMVAGGLYEKLDTVMFLVRFYVVDKASKLWDSVIFQRCLRWGLVASTLAFVFYGTSYLFGQHPAEISSFGYVGFDSVVIVSLPFAVPWLLEVLSAFLSVSAMLGLVYAAARFAPSNCFGLSKDMKVNGVLALLVGISLPYWLNLDTLSRSEIVNLIPCLLALYSGIGLVVVAVWSPIIEACKATKAYIKSDSRNPFAVRFRTYQTGVFALMFGVALGIGYGLMECGLTVGLVVGLSLGTAAAFLTTLLAYSLTLVFRCLVWAVVTVYSLGRGPAVKCWNWLNFRKL